MADWHMKRIIIYSLLQFSFMEGPWYRNLCCSLSLASHTAIPFCTVRGQNSLPKRWMQILPLTDWVLLIHEFKFKSLSMGSITTTAAIERLLYLGENLDVTSMQQMNMARKVRATFEDFFPCQSILEHWVLFHRVNIDI